MGRWEGLYERLPVLGQHAAVSLYGVYWHWRRFGPGFRRAAAEYRIRERFRAEQWRAWQQQRVTELLSVAATEVPYYRGAWTASEKAAARAGRLEEIPLLEKEPLRAEPEAFLREGWRPRRRYAFATSGSTGTPIVSIWTGAEIRDSMALREVRSARWAGVSFSQPRATFSGRLVEPNPESTGPYYRFNLAERQAYMSAFHLRSDTASAYVDVLRRHRIAWLTGYAVSYYLLARLILEQRLNVPPLRAVITTSEKVTCDMRTVMEAAYGCRVYEEYSTVENALFASECEAGRLHISPDAGIVELLRSDGSPCRPGEVGEVVATCLMRHYQPLIRFRLGDLAQWEAASCECGRAMPVLKDVVGRIEEVVTAPDGRQMVRFHGIFVDQPHIREGQIVQETLHRIRVKVVPVDGFGSRDAEDIVRRVRRRLGPQVEVIVEPVPEIPRTAAGKFRAVVSLLPGKSRSSEAAPLPEKSLLS
ncbi:MAG: phenylacetate--CoA ligase family protein [Thermoanaerobaculia bacterium]